VIRGVTELVAKFTPMIEQYLKIKKENQDCILFFRLGDFYEMFFEDAVLASKELDIVLTGRDGGQKEKIPMCGIPYHSANNYVARLIGRGYRIAICEQVEDPKCAQGLVNREVIKIITPGTIMDDSILEDNQNNYLAAIVRDQNNNGFAYVDISTGDFRVSEFTGEDKDLKLESELLRLAPSEILMNMGPSLEIGWQMPPDLIDNKAISDIPEELLSYDRARDYIVKYFEIGSIESFGLKEYVNGVKAAAAIISFLNKTQKTSLKQVRSIRVCDTESYLDMDFYTRRNLELTATMREGKREGSLLSILDSCRTSMGRRMLRKWIEQPLKQKIQIESRLDGVEELKENLIIRDEIKTMLDGIYDLERLAGKLGSGIANPRDLLAIKNSIRSLKIMQNKMQDLHSNILQEIAAMDTLEDLYELIDCSIDDEAGISIKEGNIIKIGYNSEIDELKSFSEKGSAWLVEFENQEKERTGIKHLKAGFNKVFGYYIEVSKSNLSRVPPDYVRKQTLVNNERFICEELKNYEEKILGTRERLFSREYEEFLLIRNKLSEHINRIQDTAHKIAVLDVLYSLAETAYNNDYVRPRIDNSEVIEIISGRHPVVEKNLSDSRFVPNDVRLGINDKNFAIITGPNMGGKSTYMRQTALLVLMGQMGSFIPAESACIGIVDKIFTRVGASDNLSAGQSTFMVEMVEVANILNNATQRSLIILDEIGRGTSTYDGLSIARAVSEYLIEKVKGRTLFATHYHEITDLADKYQEVINLSVSVHETEDTVVFLKKVLQGKADKSYGIHVARLAGLPVCLIERAQEVLQDLEKGPHKVNNSDYVTQPSLFAPQNPVIIELEELDINDLTPKDAINILYRWKDRIS